MAWSHYASQYEEKIMATVLPLLIDAVADMDKRGIGRKYEVAPG